MDPINETNLIISELTTGFSDINMDNYIRMAFLLLCILLMVLIIRIMVDNINRG